MHQRSRPVADAYIEAIVSNYLLRSRQLEKVFSVDCKPVSTLCLRGILQYMKNRGRREARLWLDQIIDECREYDQ